MSEPIFERLAREVIHLAHDAEHSISHITHRTRYHQPSSSNVPKGTTVSVLDNIQKDITEGAAYVKPWADRLGTYLDDITGVFGKADDLAANLERYTQEPLVEDVLSVLEAVPGAREVLTPVLAGLKMLASGAATTPAPAIAGPVTTSVAAGGVTTQLVAS